MTRPRSQLIVLDSTPYYHCIARCVRQAYLCGTDADSGRCFDHRKAWLIARMRRLAQAFAIDIAAYAVMSNHYHLVLHVNRERSRHWSKDEVIRRWLMLYSGPPLIQRYREGKRLLKAEQAQLDQWVDSRRQRLSSISQFMACMNEYIARRANQEDRCKGRFWEGRFKSQALLDDAALLSCMAYVDLNPIRAGLAANLETSAFTSIQQRLQQLRRKHPPRRGPRLLPFTQVVSHHPKGAYLPFKLQDYIALVDWTGRSIRPDKRGHIASRTPNALEILNLSPEQWQTLALHIQKHAIVMLNGLQAIAKWEGKGQRQAA